MENESNNELNNLSNEIYGVWLGNNYYKMPKEITYDELDGLYGDENLLYYGIFHLM